MKRSEFPIMFLMLTSVGILLTVGSCHNAIDPTPGKTGQIQSLGTAPPTPSQTEPTVIPSTTSSSGPGFAGDVHVEGLPASVLQAHIARVFLITWFTLSTDEYAIVEMAPNGEFIQWHAIPNWAFQPQGGGHLSKEQQMEVRAILEKMVTMPSTAQLVGSSPITLSFVWEGKNHIRSYNKTRCPDALRHLLEILDVAMEHDPSSTETLQSQCQGDDEYQQQAQEVTLTAETAVVPYEWRDKLGVTHGNPLLFCVTWFDQPFSGSYDKLWLFAPNHVRYYQVDGEEEHEVADGLLTDEGRLKVQDALEELTDLDLVNSEPFSDTATIIVSFPWEADYHLLIFGDSNCPESVHQLLTASDAALMQSEPEFDGLQYP